MVSISKVCQLVDLARSTLLYYERIGIISPHRNGENGYREYSKEDVNRLLLVKQLKLAGFSLKEAIKVINGSLDATTLQKRYTAVEEKIEAMTMSRDVLKSLIIKTTGTIPGESENNCSEKNWHAGFEKIGGQIHDQWLQSMGFSEKESTYIRWVTRNMSDNEIYMKDFFRVFERMQRQGPGSKQTSLKVVDLIKEQIELKNILDIGCGKGQSSFILAQNTDATVTALDNHQPFLDHILLEATRLGLKERLVTSNQSMVDLDLPRPGFDLIWSEGSAYFMGFEKALKDWASLLRKDGLMFISECVWLTDAPSSKCVDYFNIEYPVMEHKDKREAQAKALGYKILSSFTLPHSDWIDFYDDMEQQIQMVTKGSKSSKAFADMISEIEMARECLGDFGYLCLLLRKENNDNV